MGKLIALGVLVFFAVGIALEHVIDTIFSPEAEERIQATSNLFIAAQRESETITAKRPGNERQQPRPPSRENCTAANLHSMTHPPMTGTVIRVIDGDTIVVMVDGIEMRIRLWGIDAPESDQKEGAAAQRELENMTPLDSRVIIHPLTLDRYGGVVGNIGKDSEWSVNFMMVVHGQAYHYKEPSAMRNPCLLEAEKIAKDSRIGIWQDGANGGIRPWEHRRNRGKRLTDI